MARVSIKWQKVEGGAFDEVDIFDDEQMMFLNASELHRCVVYCDAMGLLRIKDQFANIPMMPTTPRPWTFVGETAKMIALHYNR